jgi:hypothetical protein
MKGLKMPVLRVVFMPGMRYSQIIGANMTQVRKIVDSSALDGIFDLPPVFKNRKIEVIMFPVEEKTEKLPQFTREQIKEWSQSPEIQALVGILKDAGLPPDITMKDIRQMRLEEKYKEYL